MKKILVGFDGSEGSEQALNRAMMLLDDYGILYLLAVIPGLSDKAFIDDNMYKTMKRKAQNLINGVIADIGSHSADFISRIIVPLLDRCTEDNHDDYFSFVAS